MATYSDTDLDDAVAAGVLSPDAAAAFREYAEGKRPTPAADEEHLRLVTSFNDVFVVIAGVLALSASIGLVRAGTDSPMAPGLVTMGASWLLAEYFTRRRRMALPSMVFLLTFVAGAFWTGAASLPLWFGDASERLYDGSLGLYGMFELLAVEHGLVAAFGFAALAAWGHWWRFRVPITVAAGVAAFVGVAVAGLAEVAGDFVQEWLSAIILGSGLGVFALAMYWDLSDPQRHTRRADVAFWLHLVASVLIVHPIFLFLSLVGDGALVSGAWKAWSVVGIYTLMGIVALIVDRRALLVSGLLYLVLAVGGLLEEVVAIGMEFAVSSFFIGAILLLLSVFWKQSRAPLLANLPPAWRGRLPPPA